MTHFIKERYRIGRFSDALPIAPASILPDVRNVLLRACTRTAKLVENGKLRTREQKNSNLAKNELAEEWQQDE